MSNPIKDGTGTGTLAKVDGSNRLATTATTQPGFTSASKKGDAYFISTGVINLSTASENGMLYLVSNEPSPIVIDSITIQCGTSDVTGDVLRRDYVQPQTGDVITNAVPAVISNLLVASPKTLNAVVYTGADLDGTFSGAVFSDTTLVHQSVNEPIGYGVIIPFGAALGLTLQPPSGNSSLNVQVIVVVHLLDAE